MSRSGDELEGVSVGIFLAPRGTEDVEFTEPRAALVDAGADVTVVGPETGEAETVEGDLDPAGTHEVETAAADAAQGDFDALVVPGGTVGADRLRADDDVVGLVEGHVEDDRPIGVICHGPWVLVEADVVEGRTSTSYPSLRTDVVNAGGEWVDEEVVVDGRLVTSRKPDDLDAFCERLLETFAMPA